MIDLQNFSGFNIARTRYPSMAMLTITPIA